ncbi:MAG: hypothetical protein ACOY3P_20690, partial [Planctomycetota bacterium]
MMTSVSRPWAIVAAGAAILLSTCCPALAAPKKGKSTLPAEPPLVAVQLLLGKPEDEDTERRLEALGQQIACDLESARAVLAALDADARVQVATLRAELLLWLARGNEVRNGSQKGTMPTEELGPLAAVLLDHADPFVRGIAEWAIATRLAAEYECAEERVDGRRVAKKWPGGNGPEWYRRWAALGDDSALELDYVRQTVALGKHRTAKGLLEAAEAHVKRAEQLAERVRDLGIPAQVEAAEAKAAQASAALARLVTAAEASPDLTKLRKLYLQLRLAVREVVLGNPDIDFRKILFAVRQAPTSNGNITVGRWNTHAPGGDIYVKQGFSPSAPARPLLAGRLGPGHVRGLELSWDADKLVFAYARQPGRAGAPVLREKSDLGGYFGQGVGETEEMSHLFEVRIDGTGLRQLTDAKQHADQEPTYLPNGDIVFVSDRSNFGSQCAGALEQDNMILNLHRCDGDGKNIRGLSNNKDFDRHPHMMDTGQLLFLRWEYQERHLWQTHTLWTCRPDGSMTDALYKQHIESGPMSLREARQVYGQTKLAAIACGHHNYDQGAVFLVDYAHGINDRNGMRNITPGVSGTEGGYGGVKTVAEGGVHDNGGHYMFPYPLSDKSFLVAYSYKRPERNAGQNYALYYIDVWGNKELIHRDKQMSVAYLSPVRPTPRPPVLHELPPAPEEGRFAIAAVANVQAGWPELEAGSVKYLRISQKVPWPCVRDESKACGFNDLHWMPAAWEPVLGMWDWGHARVIGMVPVEEDGSAHFKVPADQTVYFHALDENFIELRRMRSNVTFQQGEMRTCIGCHESKGAAPPLASDGVPLALRRAPSTPLPPPWGDRLVPDYERDIQPIFDRHCTSCHGENEPEGGLEFTSRKIDGYMQSYRTLFALRAEDRTPFAKGYWGIWRPDQPPLSDEAADWGKTFLKNVLKDPPAAQLVRLADYTGGSEVTQPLEFGSGRSRLTLTLLNDPEHIKEVNISRDEWLSLVTWLDLNAQYW